MTADIQKLGFYATPPHNCSYFSDRQAVTLFADPKFPKTIQLYSLLIRYGFRRSGKHLYQPHCASCSACIPVRIPIHDFTPRRSQQRTWRRNKDITINALPAEYQEDHFKLYKNYLSFRHPHGGMENPTAESYMDFLMTDWANTIFYEMKLEEKLMAIAVVDQLNDGLSAVYTFFNNEYLKRGLGTYAILFEIEEAKRLGLNWLYLGYWIENCKKMTYKKEFQPLEYYYNGQWQRQPNKEII